MDLYYEAADRHGPARIAVTSVQGLASQNFDEMSEFTINQSKSQLKDLLDTYNERVDEVELDKSLLIRLPKRVSKKSVYNPEQRRRV